MRYKEGVSALKIRDAAALLGTSTDTVRRLVEAGTLRAVPGPGPQTVDGASLAAYLRDERPAPPDVLGTGTSARNRLTGLVTEVLVDGVMAEVTIQCGPFSVTSLMSARSARALQLEPGSLAVAVIKATTVIVETPVGQGESA